MTDPNTLLSGGCALISLLALQHTRGSAARAHRRCADTARYHGQLDYANKLDRSARRLARATWPFSHYAHTD